MKRILVVLASVIGVLVVIGICAFVAISQIPCCAIQPKVYLETVTDNTDGTTALMISMTFDDVDELHAFDANGVLIATIPAAFEQKDNSHSYDWQISVPRDTQRIELAMSESLPYGIEVESSLPQWQTLDVTTTIGFERVLALRLEVINWENEQEAMTQLTTSYDAFSQLYLYDENEQRIASIDTAFVWDTKSNEYQWQLEIAPEVHRIELQPRGALKMTTDIYTAKPGWLEDEQRIGFFRGVRPLLMLTSVSEQMEFRFEASQAVFAQIVVMQSDGIVIATIPVAFEPGTQTQKYQWRVTLPENTDRVVFVPVPSETRRMVLLSDDPDWNVITIGDDIGFIYSPY